MMPRILHFWQCQDRKRHSDKTKQKAAEVTVQAVDLWREKKQRNKKMKQFIEIQAQQASAIKPLHFCEMSFICIYNLHIQTSRT